MIKSSFLLYSVNNVFLGIRKYILHKPIFTKLYFPLPEVQKPKGTADLILVTSI